MIDKTNNIETVTLCEKIKLTQIFSPTNNWTVFHDIYKILQNEVISASNRIMSICNIYNSFANKDDSIKWVLDNYGNDKIRNVLYQVSRNYCKSSYSKNANAVSNDIYSKYFSGANSYKNKINKGTGNPPMTFTEKIPLYATVQGYKIECVDFDKGYYSIELPFLNQSCKDGITINKNIKNKNGKYEKVENKIELNSTRLKFGINICKNKRQVEIITNIMNGTYKFGDSKLQRVESKDRGKKFDYYLLLSYTKPKKKDMELLIENIMGVDLGIVVPAYCAVNYNDYLRKPIGDSTIIQQNKKQESINRRLQKNIKYNLRNGKGRKYKLDGFDGNANKIANRNSTYNFNIASEIVEHAIKWKCGTIHMEDLAGIYASRPEDRFLKSWTYYDLQQKITNKANENGIEVIYINPYHTSQTCSKCGHWEKGQRINQSTFYCKSCGYKVNADFNAARNIAMSNKYIK